MKFSEWVAQKEETPDAGEFLYLACVLHAASQKEIVQVARKFMLENTSSVFPPHWNGWAHHMTVKYKPLLSDMKLYEGKFGQPFTIEIEGFAYDDFGLAAFVKSPVHCANAVPHITIATSTGVGPEYSNQLLQDRSKWRRYLEVDKMYSYLLGVRSDDTVWPAVPGALASPTCILK